MSEASIRNDAGDRFRLWLDDPYHRLKPYPGSPDDLCTCSDEPPIKLMSTLGENPIHCMRCNREVPPERLRLETREVDAVASWQSVQGAIEMLELDSGPYELWARAQLMDPNSPTNRRGLEVSGLLRAHRCYFWFFQPIGIDEDIPGLTNCPVCDRRLVRYDDGIFPQLICEDDWVVTEFRELMPDLDDNEE